MYPYDELFMLRCIELSQESVDNGDDAFGCLIARSGTLIAEGRNNHRNNIAEHAEVVALQTARMALNTIDLSDCTLYTSCEPCPMCYSAAHCAKIPLIYYGATQDDAKDIGFDVR